MPEKSREFAIIERFFAGLITTTSPEILLGPGDDCGIFAVPAGHEVCISTDTLTAGVHFPEGAPAAVIAQRALVANLSDLAAMGAQPLTCTLALTLDEQAATDAWLAPFAERLRQLVAEFAIPLIGGNLSRGPLSLTFTVLGTVPVGTALRRDGARVGDDVYVTGNVGDAAAGLRQLQQGVAADPALLARYQSPIPRLATAMALRGIASSAIDISDGLLADLDHISERSGLGMDIQLQRLPLSPALLANFNLAQARQLALAGGDDYEVCFTAAIAQRQAIMHIATITGVPISLIGEVTDGRQVQVLDADGRVMPVTHRGYGHFGGGA
jgi:thiamine-monophosphate kinase